MVKNVHFQSKKAKNGQFQGKHGKKKRSKMGNFSQKMVKNVHCQSKIDKNGLFQGKKGGQMSIFKAKKANNGPKWAFSRQKGEKWAVSRQKWQKMVNDGHF